MAADKEQRELATAARNARHAISDLIKEAEDVEPDGQVTQALNNVLKVIIAVESQIKAGPPPVPGTGPEPTEDELMEPGAEQLPPELAALMGGAEPPMPMAPPASAMEELRGAFPAGPAGPDVLPPGM